MSCNRKSVKQHGKKYFLTTLLKYIICLYDNHSIQFYRLNEDEEESRSQSISLNPKIDFDDVTDSDIMLVNYNYR